LEINVATRDLNDLLTLLHNTARSTQKKVDEMQLEKLHSVINANQNGQPESLTLECQLPSGDGGKRTHEFLRVPLASLYSSESLKIQEISVEFACDVKKTKHKRSDSQDKYVITPLADMCEEKEYCRTFKIITREESDFTTETTIDSLPIDDYLDRLDEKSATETKWDSFKNKISGRLLLLLFLLLIDLAFLFFVNM